MSAAGSLSDLRRRLARTGTSTDAARRRSAPAYCPEALAARAGGSWAAQSEAPVLVIDESLAADTPHGACRLADFAAMNAETLALIGGLETDRPAPPRQTLFLDTETTGLSGGAGTYAFLVGVGFFHESDFQLRQYLLPDPGSESALLRLLLELIEEHGLRQLVTFNGKSFDVPLLDMRCVLHRLERPWGRLDHVDLLYPARTLWKRRFRDCSLQTLERRVLRLGRGADVPSALIPGSYFSFLRRGDFPLLPLILKHNRWDLLTLVGLACVVARALGDPGREPAVEPGRAAALLVSRNRLHDAVRLLEAAGAADDPDGGGLQLAHVHKRLGHFDRALDLYRASLARSRPPRSAFEETAKLLEHKRRDLPGALEVVTAALERFGSCPELEARRHRLQCRIAGRRWY